MRLGRQSLVLMLSLIALPIWAASAEPNGAFEVDRISEHVRILSSDAYEGRAPATAGEDLTLAYLIDQFSAFGLEPGAPGGRWLQPVELVRLTRPEDARFSLSNEGGETELIDGRDAIVFSIFAGSVDVSEAPLVFVGFGLDAPEIGWTDFEGVDLTGKIAILRAGIPDAGGFDDVTRGKYGSIRQRFENAFARGAVGAAYFTPGVTRDNWQRNVNSFRAAQYQKQRDEKEMANPPATMRLPADGVAEIFALAGIDFETAMEAAETRDFRAITLANNSLSVKYEVLGEDIVTNNVIARLSGKVRPSEAVLFTAHWDHLGRSIPDETGDEIYNGAIDNAAGVSGLIELARAFANDEPTERSILFLATTGEELGLWGIRQYADKPSIPLERTAVVLNIDTMSLKGPTRKARILEVGLTSIDSDEAVRMARIQGRQIAPSEPDPAKIYSRSDHIILARRGVPAFYMGWGRDRVEEGPYAGEDFFSYYHQPSDEWRADYDWRGAAQDLELRYLIARDIANSTEWPRWSKEADYRSVRQQSKRQRRRGRSSPLAGH